MFTVKKLLGNNGVLAVDMERKEEVIFLGKGVGFGKKVNMPFETPPRGIKKYRLQHDTQKGDSAKLLNSVEPVYLEIASEIIKLAEERFGGIDENILLPLADHIAFTIIRLNTDIDLTNPMSADIRMLFEEEYEVAAAGREIIRAKTGYLIPEDEVSFITLYIHSALSDTKVTQALEIPGIIRDCLAHLEETDGINIDKGSFAYNRLLYHIKCMLARVRNNEALDNDIVDFIQEKCAESLETAREICDRLGSKLGESFSDNEIAYLALHIQRIKTM